ncbi:unnamed protein product [Rotaria sordida]|uniref:Uncharacterized protein n=1 Tax=Rotaria sordida TaxID=392033 RepID=A0A815AUG3_9BILA|nr:unnamed protein product [Rotaria sordida]CAF1542007.1 unnamed protein product [Rotaria sordida]
MVKNADYQLRTNILALHNLYPSWPNRRIASELQNSENPPSKPRYLILKIIKQTIERGTVEDRPRSGRKRTTRTAQFKQKVQKFIYNKKNRSTRKCNDFLKRKNIKTSKSSVWRLCKESKWKFFRLKRSQKLTATHKANRVTTCRILPQKYGVNRNAKRFQWRKVLNTDFSGSIRLIRPNNNRNDGIWAATADEIDSDNRNAGVQKFSAGVILWGGISDDGLYPRNAPFYFNEWLDKKCIQIGKTRRTLDSRLYSMFIQQVIAPTVKQIRPQMDLIFQDDCDRKQRTKQVLGTVTKYFHQRIDPNDCTSKKADIWPIENIWAIIREKLRGIEFQNIRTLKAAINKVWRSIDATTCKKMMESIPRRMMAVIEKDGSNIHKEDYE